MVAEDRRVIVTGAASGIGAATIERLTHSGTSVFAVDVNAERLDAVAGAFGVASLAVDLTTSDAAEAVVRAASTTGPPAALCNVAGVLDRFMPVGELTDEVWERVFAVNVTAPMRLMRAVIPSMMSAGGGVIVNVASIAGFAGGRAGAAYTASKHAIVGLTRNTAAMYRGDGIRCVAVAPGGVETGMEAGGTVSEHGRGKLPSPTDVGIERARPDEIAAVIEFLLSDAAGQIAGSVVVADGGWTSV